MMMMMMMMMMMINSFCGMVDDDVSWHCQRSSPWRISNTLRAGFSEHFFLQNTSVGGIWKSADLQISGYMTSFYVDIFITALAIYVEVCEDLRGVPLWSSRSSQVEAWWGSCQLSVEVFGNLRAAASARFTFPGPYPLSVEHVDKWITNHVLNDVLR